MRIRPGSDRNVLVTGRGLGKLAERPLVEFLAEPFPGTLAQAIVVVFPPEMSV